MKLFYSPSGNNKLTNNPHKLISAGLNNKNSFEKQQDENKILPNTNMQKLANVKLNIAFKLKLPKLNLLKGNNYSLDFNSNNQSYLRGLSFNGQDKCIKIRKKTGKSIFTNSIVDNALGTVLSSENVISSNSQRDFNKREFLKSNYVDNNNINYANSMSRKFDGKKINNKMFLNFEEEEEHSQIFLSDKLEENHFNRLHTFSSTSRKMEEEEKNKANNVFNKVLEFEIIKNSKINKHRRNNTNADTRGLNMLNIQGNNNEEAFEKLKRNKKQKLKNKNINIISSREFIYNDEYDFELENNVDLNSQQNENPKKLKNSRKYDKFNSLNVNSLNSNLKNNSINKDDGKGLKNLIIRNSSPNACCRNLSINSESSKFSNISLLENPIFKDESRKSIDKINKENPQTILNRREMRIRTGVSKSPPIKIMFSPINNINLGDNGVMIPSIPIMVNSGCQTTEAHVPNFSEVKDEIKDIQDKTDPDPNKQENFQKIHKVKKNKENYRAKNSLKNIFIKYSKEIEMKRKLMNMMFNNESSVFNNSLNNSKKKNELILPEIIIQSRFKI